MALGSQCYVTIPPAAAPGRGIIRRAIEDIFAAIEHDAAPHSKFLVRASYLQIYNEVGIPAHCGCIKGACAWCHPAVADVHLHPSALAVDLQAQKDLLLTAWQCKELCDALQCTDVPRR